jgi:protein HIRA/HIR1
MDLSWYILLNLSAKN